MARSAPEKKRRTHAAKLTFDVLEDRLAPAATMMVSFDASSNTLDIQPNAAAAQATGAAQASVTVIEFSNNSQWLISASGATLALGTGTSSGFDLSSDASRLIINPGGSIKVSIDSLNISGPSGTTTNNDIVNLEGVSLSGSLTVSAGTLNLESAQSFLGTVTVNTAATTTKYDPSFTGFQSITAAGVDFETLGFAPFNLIRFPNQTGLTDTYLVYDITTSAGGTTDDTLVILDVNGQTLTDFSGNTLEITDNDQINSGNAETISNCVVAPDAVVSALDASLTTGSSLTFLSTGVPYQGAVTISGPVPTGQPFAGDFYITGPNWAAYGYARGDLLTIDNASNSNASISNTATFVVDQPVGDILYIQASSSIQAADDGNDADVIVTCADFNPGIQAVSLTMNVTGQGNSINGAISGLASGVLPTILNATTEDGDITLQDVPGQAISGFTFDSTLVLAP